MKRNLVDPMHVFDERGHPLKSYEHLEAEVERLEEENAKLKRLLKAKLMSEEGVPLHTEPQAAALLH